jgi:hypothetical protein
MGLEVNTSLLEGLYSIPGRKWDQLMDSFNAELLVSRLKRSTRLLNFGEHFYKFITVIGHLVATTPLLGVVFAFLKTSKERLVGKRAYAWPMNLPRSDRHMLCEINL